jgi:prefoldin subunit 5
LTLPAIPQRLLDDLGELKELVRDLLTTEERLTRTSESMNRKVDALDVANDRLSQALDELRGFNAKLDHLDSRVERLENEMRLVRRATDEIREVVPDLNRGPLEKAKDALTSG